MRSASVFIISVFCAIAFSCCRESHHDEAVEKAEEMRGIVPVIYPEAGTKTVSFKTLGRSSFAVGDSIHITSFKRTANPDPDISYSGIPFKCTATNTWNRTTSSPEKLYWTDPESDHSIIAYSKPAAASFQNKFKYSGGVYYSAIGDPLTLDSLDFSGGNDYLAAEDFLVSYNTAIKPEVNASLTFRHALSQVRVTVNIAQFSSYLTVASDSIIVRNLKLEDIPCIYKWKQDKWITECVEDSDDSTIKNLWGDAVAWDRKRDIKLWIPDQTGDGSGVNKTFSFYGLISPAEMDSVNVVFDIEYKNPIGSNRLTKVFQATVKSSGTVNFQPGKCTNFNISLSHLNGEIITGVSYTDWTYTTDESSSVIELNDIFLSTTIRDSVKLHSDDGVVLENATWLYQNGDGIYDIRENDGTSLENAYVIASAPQLLSFAYEVKNGMDFSGRYVKLDAGIVMQPSLSDTTINWIGIGDDAHLFNGYFIFNQCRLSCHYGAPLFYELGSSAVVEGLDIQTLGATDAAVAVTNSGLIFGSSVKGDISGSGSFVSTNNGYIIGSRHIGEISGAGDCGGIAGNNSGTIAACCHAGEITGAATGGIAGGNTAADEVKYSYYDSSLLTPTYSDGSTAKTTSAFQRYAFVGSSDKTNVDTGSLNGGLHYWIQNEYTGTATIKARMLAHNFTFVEGDYPALDVNSTEEEPEDPEESESGNIETDPEEED